MVRTPLVDRFWAKVQVTPGCWTWTGGRTGGGGYGVLNDEQDRKVMAHRVSYEIHFGEIPEGLEIDHVWPRCFGGACPNPDHLEAVTPEINKSRQGAAIERCRKGHRFTPENTYRDSKGWRRCRWCNRDRQKDLRSKSKITGEAHV